MSLEEEVKKPANKDYKLSEAERRSASSALYNELMASQNYIAPSQEELVAPTPQSPASSDYTTAPESSGQPQPIYAANTEGLEKEEAPEKLPAHEAETLQAPEKQRMDGRRNNKALVFGATAIILILAIIGTIFLTPGGMTGYITATREVQQTIDFNQGFSQRTETQIDLGTITGLRISGNLEGTSAKVKLIVNGTEYLVADITNPNTENAPTEAEPMPEEETPQYTITTDKSSYLLGETVTITITPETENKSLYVSYGEQTQILETNTYITEEPGEHQAIALITLPNDILHIETNFTVSNESINETTPAEETGIPESTEAEETPEETIPETLADTTIFEFTGLCEETCSMPEASSATLVIETAENSTLTITQIITTQQIENNAPIQTQAVPDLTIIQGESKTLDLNEYFSDADRDAVQFDINEIPEIDATISQDVLTITSAIPGVYTAFIYATDGDELVTSNTFTITITGTEEPVGETNLTTNTTTNETTTDTTTELPIITDPCSNPDLNLRPSTCFAGLEEQAFESLALPLLDRERGTAGMFTRFGNLIIKGLLVQDATGTPDDNDFQIGFTETSEFTETSTKTVWIDSETGNLYLKGKIYENQEILEPAQYNTFVVRNKFGLILGYFDQLTGNLYLRGNIVQLGRI